MTNLMISRGARVKPPMAPRQPGRIRQGVHNIKFATGYWRLSSVDQFGVRCVAYKNLFGLGKVVEGLWAIGGKRIDTPKELVNKHLELNKKLNTARKRMSEWYSPLKVLGISLLTGLAVAAPFGAKIAGMFLSMSASLYTGLGLCLAATTVITFSLIQTVIRKLDAKLRIWKNDKALTANDDKIRELSSTQGNALETALLLHQKQGVRENILAMLEPSNPAWCRRVRQRIAELALDIQELDIRDIDTLEINPSERIAQAEGNELKELLQQIYDGNIPLSKDELAGVRDKLEGKSRDLESMQQTETVADYQDLIDNIIDEIDEELK